MLKLFSWDVPNQPATSARRARRWLSGVLGLLLPALGAQAQQLVPPSFFSTDASARQAAAASPVAAKLRGFRPLTLNAAGMRAALATAPLEGQANAQPLLLALPLPDGSTATFRVLEAPVMAPVLAAQFPAIKTYVGVGVDDPAASVRLDFTPLGFHAQVLSPATGTFYIDPASRTTTTRYLSFWKRDMPGNSFTCEVKTNRAARTAGGAGQRITSRTLRTYRLALAATGEYTAYYGGTVAAAQAAMVTSVNRVVGVYEKELDVRLVLVAGNSQLIYTNATTDPYTNDDGSAMLGENQTNVDNLIGNANYDIGHVFSTGGGGIAGLGVVCQAGAKAQGVTGSPAPVGDAFDIDYVAHEMGHQFGGNHTFNSTAGSCGGGNRNASTAYEPGSGSTIMAYAGICGASDLQPNSDPYFHVISFEEIQAYIGTTTCAATSSTGNSAPVVTLPAGGKVMPISTPFRLTGSAYDQENDALSYCWEEFDLGTSGSPTATQTANNNVPLFRSFNPTTSPTRYFPRLSNIIANTVTIGERLPTVSRSLKFRLTVRDQHNGTQGIVGGINSGFSTLDLTTTSAAGPFLVTSPNTAVSWAGGSAQAVTWNVAGTTANGVNCATVNIRLSTDGGLTYPTLLLAGTANDGTESVTLPSVATTTARIMVEAADNYFFDISNANFTITAATACAAPTSLTVSSIARTTATLGITGSGATSYTITTSPATTTQIVNGTTSSVSLTGLTAGTTYTVNVTSSCGTSATSTTATTSFATLAPPACNEATNLAVSNVMTTSATFTFTPSATASTYTITTSPTTTTQTVAAGPVTFSNLTPATNYTIFITSNCTGGGTATDALTFGTRPLNDECSAAVSLTSGTSCVTTAGSLTGATQSLPASTCSGYASPSANDVWYTFVATGNTHTVRVVSAADGVLEVLTGTCGSLTSVGCIDAAGSGGETITRTNLVSGTRYYVRYYAYGATPTDGTFTICVTNPTCNPPTALALASSTATSLTVSFTAASGTNAASYTATATPSAGGTTQTVTTTTSPVTLSNLMPNTSYVVSIATNCTNSGPSATASATFSTALGDLTVSTAQAVGGAYNNVTITSGGVATLAANLTVNGVLTVQSGGSLQTDATYDVQGPGSLVLAAGATLIEVNEAGLANTASGGFLLTSAAGLSFSPDANYVFAGTAAQQTGPLQPNGARNLTVNNSAGVTLTNNLAVSQVVRLQSGNLTLNSKVLRLLSSSAGTALVDNTGGAVLGSTASMQRAITGGVTNGPGYRHFSSPVQAIAVDSLRTGGIAPVVNAAYNTSATPSLVTPFPTVFGYDQNRIATTTSNYGDFDKGYFSPASLSDAMQPNRGYTVNTSPTATPVRFTGTFNTGAQSVGPLARLNATNDTGWQLLGNPYPSPLDWSTVTATQRPGMAAALYVFQSTSQYGGMYRSYTNGIGNASPLVEAGSGYFVQVATAGTTGSVNLTDANRVTTFGTQTPFGRQAADLRPQLQLRVAGAGLTDDTYLYFEAGATAGVDANYDAAKLPNSTGLNLASLADATPLAIQGLAPLTGTAEVVVPLALAVPAAGSFAFEVADLANFAGLAVYLRDTQAGTQQPLLAGTRYAFTQAAGAASTGRFALVFRPAGVLAAQPALSATQVSVFPNPAHGSFTVLLPPVAGQRAVQATLLNVLGQPVADRSIALNAAGASASFDTRGLAPGVYLLRLAAGDQTLTQRLTVE